MASLSWAYQLRYGLGRIKKALQERRDRRDWNAEVSEEIKVSRARLRELKNKYRGQRCFVIGNGPSLGKMDLNLLRDEYVFASNAFFLKLPDLNFRPQFFSVEDHLVAEDYREDFANLKDTFKFYPYDLRETLRFDDNSAYVLFSRAYDVMLSEEKFPKFSSDALNETYWGGTVLFFNLQLAAFMGFEKIYLIGVDLTYKIPEGIKQRGSVLISTADDPNHFDPRYFGAGKRWHLPETERMQRAFWRACCSLRDEGKELFNATVGGNLQQVPRANYEDLFKSR
ncbi:MAG TPA: 6-hydroxymethylpterin diphosphokinase MptE-like protein [Bdellovibrionota bacterium]|jgi:hypothetical protein|nr:6-hydroxymethylpterin diphosphokinase MptE-like protein [Bdellovibrionota bacterium]